MGWTAAGLQRAFTEPRQAFHVYTPPVRSRPRRPWTVAEVEAFLRTYLEFVQAHKGRAPSQTVAGEKTLHLQYKRGGANSLAMGICRARLLDGSAARLKKPCASGDDGTPPRGRIGPATSAARFGNTSSTVAARFPSGGNSQKRKGIPWPNASTNCDSSATATRIKCRRKRGRS